MHPQRERNITLKHIVLGDKKYIGLQFYPDKVIQAIVKQLPERKWSNHFGMVVLPNNKTNLTAVFDAFKGVAWINTKYFFVNRPVNIGNEQLSVDHYRKRPPKVNLKYCPESFYQKLELRRYSLNTARVYITMFERFINFYPAVNDPMNLSELEVKKYLQSLVQQNKSDSYINQAINAIKFYYEVVYPVGLK